MKVSWAAKLINCHVDYIEEQDDTNNSFIEICELILLPDAPYIAQNHWIIYPSVPPYDFQFWKNSLQAALESFQWEQDKLLVENSAVIVSHMSKNLLGDRERSLLQIGAKKTSFLLGENISILNRAASSCFYVNHGHIGIEKLLDGKWTTVGTISTGILFGEESYLLGTQYISREDPVRYIAHSDAVIITILPFSKLDYLFYRNPALALNFFRMIAYRFGHLIIYHTYMSRQTDIPNTYSYFIKQHQKFLRKQKSDRSELNVSFTDSDEMKKIARNILEKLKLPPTEIILACYACRQKKDPRGKILVIFMDYIVIAQSFLGRISSHNRILYENIQNFRLLSDHCLELMLNSGDSVSVVLQSSQHVSEVLQLLSVLIEQNHIKIDKHGPLTESCNNEILNVQNMELSSSDWKVICEYGDFIEADKDEIIEYQGSSGIGLFRIKNGSFKVVRETKHEFEQDESKKISLLNSPKLITKILKS